MNERMETLVRVIVPDKSIREVRIDLDTCEVEVVWQDLSIDRGTLISADFGPQGTDMTIALDNYPDKTLRVTQSSTMEPSVFFYDVPPPPLPDEPISVPLEQEWLPPEAELV